MGRCLLNTVHDPSEAYPFPSSDCDLYDGSRSTSLLCIGAHNGLLVRVLPLAFALALLATALVLAFVDSTDVHGRRA